MISVWNNLHGYVHLNFGQIFICPSNYKCHREPFAALFWFPSQVINTPSFMPICLLGILFCCTISLYYIGLFICVPHWTLIPWKPRHSSLYFQCPDSAHHWRIESVWQILVEYNCNTGIYQLQTFVKALFSADMN